MKKLFFSLTFLLILIFGGIYSLLFTSWGNGVVASMIEDKANENKNVNFKVDRFVLTTSTIDFMANIDNNSYITVKGALYLLAKEFDLAYDVNVKELSKLDKLTNANLQGPLQTKGTVKGNKPLLNVVGTSDIFGSTTTYNAKLIDFNPSDIVFNVKKAKIEKLLHMVKQPNYARGLVDITGNIKNMEGKVVTKIYDGKVNNKVVNEAFNQKLLRALNFKGDVNTILHKDKAVSKANIYTTMANVYAKEAVASFKDGSFTTDYQVQVKDMSKLYDVTQMKMRGKVVLNGNVKKDENLLVTGNSKLLGGALDFKLLNDDFSSIIKDVELLKVLHMMYYPEVFNSKTDLTLNYNLKSQQGELDGKLINGQFKKNQYSQLLNTFAKFDITKEVYESVLVNSKINKEIIKSTVDMKSKLTHIKVPRSTLDTKKQTIDALVVTNLKGVEFDTTVTGKLNKPKVKMDTSKLLLTNEKVQKEKQRLERKIKEKLGDKLGEDAGKLLKGLFQ